MGETLIQRCRVCEEGLRVVKHFQLERQFIYEQCMNETLLTKEAPANSVPAAAVIQRVRALIGVTGRKGHVGGYISLM
jgi:hypothetical protein